MLQSKTSTTDLAEDFWFLLCKVIVSNTCYKNQKELTRNSKIKKKGKEGKQDPALQTI